MRFSPRKTLIFFDAQQRLVVVLAGPPKDPTFDEALRELLNMFAELGMNVSFSPHQRVHRRGEYKALNYGTSHGQGSQAPFVFNNNRHASIVRNLKKDRALRRVVGYQDALTRLWFPKTYARYHHAVNFVEEKCGLKPNYSCSSFPAATANFGPQVQTFRHQDAMNYAPGVCLVTCMGDHDSKKGGHIILWELGVFIEFPHGATIAIPSAVITHSNLPVAKHERRVSFTQYCSGALLRWVDNGGKTDVEMTKKELAAAKAARKEHFNNMIKYFTTIEEHIEM
jgi:hypothetical protein